MESHPNEDLIDELLRPPWNGRQASISDSVELSDARAHLQVCESCRGRVRDAEWAMQRLALLKPKLPDLPGPECPPEDVWVAIAAGHESKETKAYLGHSIRCDHCGPLLRQATADIEENLTPQEKRRIAALRSSTRLGQRGIATSLLRASVAERKRYREPEVSKPWFVAVARPFRLAFAVSLIILLTSAVWFAAWRGNEKSPQRLLAKAYAEDRTIEMRIEGAPYAPLRQDRGGLNGVNRLDRLALLQAEAIISEALKAKSDSPSWLQARGRVSLLEQDPQAAVVSFEQARRLEENSASIKIDLASAYILRGETANRPDDFGAAVELLSAVLISQPQDEVALFNYALALEKIHSKAQAAEKWEEFLKNYPSSPWAREAREHLQNLQQEAFLRQQRIARPFLSPEQISAESSPGQVSDEVDARIEEYQDLAVQQWLPQLSDSAHHSSREQRQIERALWSVASILERRHQDRWLHDLMNGMTGGHRRSEAVQLMSRSEILARTSDDVDALQTATHALSLFQKERLPAGSARALFTIAFIHQIRHQNRVCSDLARALAADAQARKYQWIRIQSELEAGNCASLSDASGMRNVQDAKQLALDHGFRILSLRAAAGVSGLYLALGDTRNAWAADADGLQEYWVSNAPLLRGYSLFAVLDDIAETQNQWFLATAILNESLPMIASNPDQIIRASEQTRLGDALLRIGAVSEAEQNFREAQRIFQSVPVGGRRETLRAEAEIGLANAQMQRGDYRAAATRLEAIRASITQVEEDDLRMAYFLACGMVRMRLGEPISAEENFTAALRLADRGERLINSEDERIKWSRRNEPLYRAIVELKLHASPNKALAYWERFKGASVRGRSVGVDTQLSENSPESDLVVDPHVMDGAALVSFMEFPRGLSIWVVNRSEVRQRWIDLSEPQLDSLVHSFLEHCSNPEYPVESIRREGAEIYKLIFLPIEAWIGENHRLILEPDGVLSLVPFESLVDGRGVYLEDRYALAISPGMDYLAVSRKWTGLTPTSSALVIGNPAARDWAALPGARQEARAVASSFNRPHLLLDAEASGADVATELPRVDVFHFSGHSFDDARSSGLVLGKETNFQARSLLDVSRARTQLVVLSACDSARGTTGFFDDDDSLVQRLASTGVPEIVASRWTIDSSATTALMKLFYERLLQGESVSDSLRHAGQSLRTNPRFAHPFYWAAFTVFGRG